MKRHRPELCFACLGFWLAACHGSGIGPAGDAGSASGSANAKEFCDSFVQAVASFQARCVGGDVAYWSQGYAAHMNCGALADPVSAGKITYDPRTGAECLQ